MSDSSQGPGSWLASDGRWYPPELWTTPQYPEPVYAPSRGPLQPTTFHPTAVRDAVPARRARTNGFAVASLICSCAGILLIGIPSVVGVVFGFVARAQIRRTNGAQRGDGLAMAGIVVGFIVVGLAILGLVVHAATRGVAGVGG